MSRHRDVTPDALRHYIEKNMAQRACMISDELDITSVEDACAYLVLSRLALLKRALHGRRAPVHPLLKRAAVDVQFLDSERTVNEFVDGPRFEIARRS
jgi:hypothetical protein